MKGVERWQELKVPWGSGDCKREWLNDAEGEKEP